MLDDLVKKLNKLLTRSTLRKWLDNDLSDITESERKISDFIDRFVVCNVFNF